ncbi:MAG: hypothetical protein ACQESR_28125, partial [Planctomycetota bacterium]
KSSTLQSSTRDKLGTTHLFYFVRFSGFSSAQSGSAPTGRGRCSGLRNGDMNSEDTMGGIRTLSPSPPGRSRLTFPPILMTREITTVQPGDAN